MSKVIVSVLKPPRPLLLVLKVMIKLLLALCGVNGGVVSDLCLIN